MFINVPNVTKTYYLDTCVWGEIAKSQTTCNKFVSFFKRNDYLAALSQYAVLELTLAKKHLRALDKLFLDMRYNICMPTLYDKVIESEINNYPKAYKLQWMPLSMITDEDNSNVMSKFACDSRIIETRDIHLQFGYDSFMNLEKFKENFPPKSEENGYTTDEADYFALCNTVEYLGRHFRNFLARFKNDIKSLDTSKILSAQIRSLFLFYKYYIHGQSPGKSDFMDFAHISYSPYVNTFVTERNISNVLKHIKSVGHMLKNTEILHVTDFIGDLST